MEFLHLNAFFLLIFPLLIFLYLLFNKETSFKNHFSKEVLEKITLSNNYMNQNVKNTLLVLSLVLFIFTLARPVMDKKEHKVKEELIPIIVAIDVSKSMLANDIYPNRLALAKQKLLKVLQNSKDSAVGVVLFAKSAFVLSPVTQDFTSLTFLVKNLDNNLNFDNGSNVLAMLEASNDLLENYTSKNIILLSDGGNKENYEKESNFALKNKIKVYAIGIASEKQTPIPTKDGYLTNKNGKIVTVGLNKNIGKLALNSGGGYISYSLNSTDIQKILEDIQSIAKKEQMNSTKLKTYTELFYYPLALALLFLFISFSSFSIGNRKIAVGLLFLSNLYLPNVQADLLDFKTLQDAKKAYKSKEFIQAEILYKSIDKSAESSYNIANSLYNQGKYKESSEIYQSIKTDDKNLQYQSLHNLGNSFVKQNKLDEAKKTYEKALKLKNDEQTEQNLETVKKALKKKKEKKKNKDGKNNKKKNDKDKKKENKDKGNKDKKENKGKKDSKKKKEENKESQKKKKEEKDKKSESKNSKEKSDKKQAQAQKMKKEISDMEEKKWLNELKKQKNKTFLRKYESKSKDENIKNPW